MNFHRESRQESYDVIVVGSGIGGLVTAALLARAGKSVLVVERHDRPGGYAHGFNRKRYRFDSGIHLISGCGENGYRGGQLIHRVLKALGVLPQQRFISIDPYTRACYPDLTLLIHQGYDACIEELAIYFPDQLTGLRRLFDICLRLSEEAAIANEVMHGGDAAQVKSRLPTLFQYRHATVAQALDQYLTDSRLKAAICTHWPYLGLPPSKASFLYWSMMFIGYTLDGAYYCKGGFQRFADLLAKAVELSNGEMLYKIAVRRIDVENGSATGVTLENGQRITAPVVVSNADAKQTIFSLVGQEHFPKRYLTASQRMHSSLSAFVVYLATNLPMQQMGAVHESFFYQGYDHDDYFRMTCDGEVSWLSATIPTLVDPSLAPKGEHIMILTTLLPYDVGQSWRQAKQSYAGRMVAIAESYFPGLREHILFMEAGSPRTMERYTLNDRGAAYGWDVTPNQIGPQRLANRSPIAGLYFTGHWSSPGGGVYGVAVSGVQTVQAILGLQRQADFWREFGVSD